MNDGQRQEIGLIVDSMTNSAMQDIIGVLRRQGCRGALDTRRLRAAVRDVVSENLLSQPEPGVAR